MMEEIEEAKKKNHEHITGDIQNSIEQKNIEKCREYERIKTRKYSARKKL